MAAILPLSVREELAEAYLLLHDHGSLSTFAQPTPPINHVDAPLVSVDSAHDSPPRAVGGASLEDLPSFSQLDRPTIMELPEDVRVELARAYERKLATIQSAMPPPPPPPPPPPLSHRPPKRTHRALPTEFAELDQDMFALLPPPIQREILDEYERRAFVSNRLEAKQEKRNESQ